MFVHLRKQFSKTIWAWGRLHGEEEKGKKEKMLVPTQSVSSVFHHQHKPHARNMPLSKPCDLRHALLRRTDKLSFQEEVSPIWRNLGAPEFMVPIPLLKTRRYHFEFRCKAEGVFHFAVRYTLFKCTCTRRAPYFALIVFLRQPVRVVDLPRPV